MQVGAGDAAGVAHRPESLTARQSNEALLYTPCRCVRDWRATYRRNAPSMRGCQPLLLVTYFTL